jgi:tRNA-dihydrouridine synthase C
LALAIARHDAGLSEGDEGRAVPWPVIASLLQLFWAGVSQRVASRHRSGRLKQWLNYLRKVYPEAQQAFDELRLIHDPALMSQWLARQEVMPPAV